MRQPEQVLPTVPARETEEGVSAKQQHQGPVRTVVLAQPLEHIDRVTRRAALHFGGIDGKVVMAGDTDSHHGQTILGTRHRCLPMPWLPGRNEDHPRQREARLRFLGKTQVGVMDRVESAAEDPQWPVSLGRGRHPGS